MNEELILKFIGGKASGAESGEIMEWLKAGDKNRHYYFQLKRKWQESISELKDNSFLEDSWERLELRMESPANLVTLSKKKSNGIWFSGQKIAVAASILFLLASALYFGILNHNNTQLAAKEYEISVPLGSRTNIILPDGSNVWLNSGSKLSYSAGFGNKTREVFLSGEGFFNVKKYTASTFVVNTGQLQLRVLGTRFNVKSYPEENTIETTLVSGIVEVQDIAKDKILKPIVLTQKQKLTYIKNDGSISLANTYEKSVKESSVLSDSRLERGNPFSLENNINPEVSSSWKDGKLIFQGETLEQLIPRLERHYNVKIALENKSMKNFKYTGTLEEISIEEVLRAIEKTSPIRYEIQKNQVTLKSKK